MRKTDKLLGLKLIFMAQESIKHFPMPLRKWPKVIAKGNFLVLVLLLSFAHIVFADNNNDGVVLRPVIEYSSEDLRDPFSNLFQLAKEKKEQSIQASQESIDPQRPKPNLENFKVQGVIWGSKFPQAIINNKILGVGDLIDGVEIVSIEKKGVALSFGGMVANLAAPGNTDILEKGNKEDK